MGQNKDSRRIFLKKLGVGSMAVALSSSFSCLGSKKKKQPNILFIFTDDHAYQAISAYGGRLEKIAPTPNIDRIAHEGMLFNKCYVANSICAPSRATILTGKHSHLNGVIDNREVFDGSQQTFPKLLQQAGYQTIMIGKWHLKSHPTGFDYWDVLPGQGHYYNPDFITPDGTTRMTGYVTDIITDKAVNWLKKRDTNKPFMLMLQHKAPHREWSPALRHLNLFDDIKIPEPFNLFDDYQGRGSAARLQDMTIDKTMLMGIDLKVKSGNKQDQLNKRVLGRMTEEQLRLWDAAYEPKNEAFRQANLSGKDLVRWKYQRYLKDYLRCIRCVDENVGQVLDYLDKSNLSDNTILIYSSDQGFYLGEHGWFDKRFMYEESFRTPLIVRWPGEIEPGSVNNHLVSNLDFAQTFLDMAGVKQPSDMQGLSLKPLMMGESPGDWRTSLYYRYYEYPGPHSVRQHEGVATTRYKLIHFYVLDEWELYDLQNDPHEMQNQYDNPDYADVVTGLKKELLRLREVYRAPDNP